MDEQLIAIIAWLVFCAFTGWMVARWVRRQQRESQRFQAQIDRDRQAQIARGEMPTTIGMD